ncbi:MAG: 50S ribosomal protein L9 [Acidobacteriota bacterium]
MRLVLTQDVDKLGKRGDVVNVAAGFGRNYLLPKNLALDASPGNVKQVELERARAAKKDARDKAAAEIVARDLTRLSISIPRKVGENDHLYGSVTAMDIAESLGKEGYEVDKRKVELGEPIKELGVFDVPVRLHRDVLAHIKVWVVKE